MKKYILILMISVLSVLGISSCKKKQVEEDVPTIGIAKLLAHPALDAIEQGIQDELNERGIKVKYDKQNANADMNIANSIASKYKSTNTDILVGIGTPMAIALANLIKTNPVIFAGITDPVQAGLVPSSTQGGQNVTGVSDAVDMELQLKNFLKITDIKNLGFIYTISEDNSVVMKKRLEEITKKLGITLHSRGITNQTEINAAAQIVAAKVDAFYVVTDNVVCSALSTVTAAAKAQNIPVFSQDPSSSKNFGGVLYTSGADYYKLGRNAGMQIAEILAGKKTSEIPPKYMTKAEETQIIVDKDVLKQLKLTIPDELVTKDTIYLEKTAN